MKITRVVKPPPRFASDVLNTFVTGLADNFQRKIYDDEALLVSLSNTLEIHDDNVRKSQTLIGKVVDLFATPIDPDNIEIDGMRLRQVFDAADKERPEGVIPGGTYRVDVYSLRQMISKAQYNIKRRSEAKR